MLTKALHHATGIMSFVVLAMLLVFISRMVGHLPYAETLPSGNPAYGIKLAQGTLLFMALFCLANAFLYIASVMKRLTH